MDRNNDNGNPGREEGSKEIEENPIWHDERTLKDLKDGILETYEPYLVMLQEQLGELTTKQNILVEQLHDENLKLAWSQNSSEYQEMFKKIQYYRNKLITLKSGMHTLHEKSTRLKKRATRVQLLKEREEITKLEQRQKELQLIGK